MSNSGRQLEIGLTDNTSDQRTPRNRLRLIPEIARESFAPYVPQRGLSRQNDWDLTRIEPDLPRAEGVAIEVSGKLQNERGTHISNACLLYTYPSPRDYA